MVLETTEEKKYMHILIDHFSRYACISTTRGQCARDFINLIDRVAKDNKINIILADQYTGLNSNELKKYLDGINTKLIFTCFYLSTV